MTLKSEIIEARDEETQSHFKYMRMANTAREQNHYSEAILLEEIARDEAKHASLLKSIVDSIESKEHEELPTRPFPHTYGDWVNLAEDIKAKYPDDPVMRAGANFQLQMIAEEIEYTRPPDEQAEASRAASEAKRWLTERAGELGIT